MAVGVDIDLSKLVRTPEKVEDVLEYLREAMPALIEALNMVGDIQRSTTVAPAKPREGMLRTANGTNWDPDGSNAAKLYVFIGGSWVVPPT